MLPPPLWGGNDGALAGASGWVPIVPRNGASGTVTCGRTRAVGPSRRSNVLTNGSGKSSGSSPRSGSVPRPAPLARGQLQDIDSQGVARAGAVTNTGPSSR